MTDGATFTLRPRIEFEVGGYVRLRAYSGHLGRDCYVYLHRLALYAHGELDSPWVGDDPREGHHEGRGGWDNHPDRLSAEFSEDHGRHHRRAQLESAEGSA